MSNANDRKQQRPTFDPPLRKSFLSGDLTGWTLDMPPHLHKFTLGFFPFYVSLIPVARLLTRPNGWFTLLLDKVLGPRNAVSIIKLVAYATFNAYVFTAVGSVYGQSTHPRGYQNNMPRLGRHEISGFAHRLMSAHHSILETFPAFGTAAALVFATHGIAKTVGASTLIDGLFLHVFLKHILFWVCYVLNDDFNRSGAHVLSISTLVSVLLELSRSL